MKLERKYDAEYFCAITKLLDRESGIDTKDNDYFRHYILADKLQIKNKCLAIRVPGGTVGGIRIDDNGLIKEICVDTNYIIKRYPQNINQILSKYVGERIDMATITK